MSDELDAICADPQALSPEADRLIAELAGAGVALATRDDGPYWFDRANSALREYVRKLEAEASEASLAGELALFMGVVQTAIETYPALAHDPFLETEMMSARGRLKSTPLSHQKMSVSKGD